MRTLVLICPVSVSRRHLATFRDHDNRLCGIRNTKTVRPQRYTRQSNNPQTRCSRFRSRRFTKTAAIETAHSSCRGQATMMMIPVFPLYLYFSSHFTQGILPGKEKWINLRMSKDGSRNKGAGCYTDASI